MRAPLKTALASWAPSLKIIIIIVINKMKITYRELREKLSDMAENVPKSQKSTRLVVKRLCVKEIESTSDRTQIQLSHESFSKLITRCHLNKQSLDKRAINHAQV